jgi:transposase
MTIVGCDFHPGWQQVAVFDSETGEIREFKLGNSNGEAERFYRQVSSPALIGLEACGNTQWSESPTSQPLCVPDVSQPTPRVWPCVRRK